jgi:predicted ATPase/DNA-binding CsgD family transcriptional regulator
MNSNVKHKNAELLVTTIPTNLPEQAFSLVGRQKEISDIQNLLTKKDVPLITLAGLGGAGKTSLAIQIAHASFEIFSGGVFFVSLASITKPNLIPVEIGRVLKIEQSQNKKIIENIKEFLLGRRVLLVLDNFEHIIDGAVYVQELLQSSSNLKIIVTSREPLRLRNEQIYPIGALDNEHALELFTKRARSLSPNFFISSTDKEAIIELCKKLDGLPLAIELAALRTKLFSPSALLSRLKPDTSTWLSASLQPVSRILNLFSSGSRDLPERQQSLRNTIAWSYELLEEKEKRIFRAASIFPAGFQIDALAILLSMNEVEVLEIVSSLVDKNLTKPAFEKYNTPHFTMVEMIREFAWDEIVRLHELTELKNAYVNLYVFLTEQADKVLKESQTADLFSRFDDEIANINLALEICITSPQGSTNWVKGYQILNSFHRYWMMYQTIFIDTDYLERARISMNEFVEENPKDVEDILLHKANISSLCGSYAWIKGNYSQAVELHSIAYEIHKQYQNDKGILESLNNISVNLANLGNYSEAIELLEKSNALCRTVGDQWAEVRNLSNMGSLYQNGEHPEKAFEIYEKGLEIANQLQNDFFIAVMNYGIGCLQVRLRNFEDAISFLQRSLDINKESQSVYLTSHTLVLYAKANILLGKPEPAIRSILEAIVSSEKVTDVDLKVDLLYVSVYILSFINLYQEAAQLVGVIQKSRAETHMVDNPYDRQSFEMVVQKIEVSLSKGEFESLKLMGSKLSLDSALAIASENLEISQSSENKKSSLQLTTREQEVLTLLAQGLTNEQISNELVVVLKTVEKHAAGIFRKLGVKNRTEAAAWALANEITNKNK